MPYCRPAAPSASLPWPSHAYLRGAERDLHAGAARLLPALCLVRDGRRRARRPGAAMRAGPAPAPRIALLPAGGSLVAPRAVAPAERPAARMAARARPARHLGGSAATPLVCHPAGRARDPRRRPERGSVTGIWYVVGFAFAGVSFVFLTIAAAWLVSHRTRWDHHKGLPYESGIDTYGDTHGRFGLSFYIYALLFVAFDIEVIFIYLWAIVFQDILLGGFVSMLIFVAILLSDLPTPGGRACRWR